MLNSLLAFAVAELIFSLSPGPAVFLVISSSMKRGFPAGVAAGLGVVSVNVVFFILSAIGVGAALVASPQLFTALKYAGAAYLAWTAFTILREIWTGPPPDAVNQTALPDRAAPVWRGSFIAGVLTQASSVKNLVIFISIIPQFIDPAGDVTTQFMALCAVSVLVELPALVGYALLASSMAQRVRNATMRRYLDGAAALTLMGIAGSIVFAPAIV